MAPVTAVPTTGPAEPAAGAPVVWHRGHLVRGHGVASGTAPDSPYPAGTIALQRPFFAASGFDLGPCQDATLNLDFPGSRWLLRQPDHRVERLCWSDRHPPETFSLWRCRLRRLGPAPGTAAADPRSGEPVPALIYYPHPETKRAHPQPGSLLEVLAPPLGAVVPGEGFALELDPRRCRRIQPARLRARLLEFLKFRVLAAQEQFFADLRPSGAGAGPARSEPDLDLARFRRWLGPAGCSEALDLDDADLARVLEQARALYTDLRP